VKKLANLMLGVTTSIGSFLEVGSLSTAATAGAEFGFALLWAIALAGVIVAILTEMSGRLSAVSRRTFVAAVRERFGVHFLLVPILAEAVIDLLLLTAEIGGAAVAIRLLTGLGFQWWILPVSALVWLVLWSGTFSLIENGIGLLGCVTLCFVVSAWLLHPDVATVAHGFVPTLPDREITRYAFYAVSIVGATVSPYLLNFYGSGMIEEESGESDLATNRIVASVGMGFGSVAAMGVLVTSAVVLGPQRILVNSYEQAALMLVPAFGRYGVLLFALSLGIGCFGAAVELALNGAYVAGQSLGWTWGVNRKRRDAARFTVVFSGVLLASTALAMTGIDPLKLTLISVALTVVIMPIVVLPFLVLMNDPAYVKTHTNSPVGNGVLAALTILGAVLAIVVIPLEILGS
jgi:Mn2+/Fe2+ NRAMP family transporter